MFNFLEKEVPLTADQVMALKIPHDENAIPLKSLISLSTVSYLVQADNKFSIRYVAVTLRGRCKNEKPHQPVIRDLIISEDLVSAYANALIHVIFPIGLPSLLYFPSHQPEKCISLGQFLKKYEDELVPDCWHAVLDTFNDKLSFQQNLLFSKKLPKSGPVILEENEDDFDEEGHFKGKFLLQLKKINNGILTHHSLQMLKAITTAKEWGEFLKVVKVKSAIST